MEGEEEKENNAKKKGLVKKRKRKKVMVIRKAGSGRSASPFPLSRMAYDHHLSYDQTDELESRSSGL